MGRPGARRFASSSAGRWCASCSKVSDTRLKEARATVSTTFGSTTKVLPLCRACFGRLSDQDLTALFARHLGVTTDAVRVAPRAPVASDPGPAPSRPEPPPPEPPVTQVPPAAPAVADVVRVAEALGAVVPGGLLRCPNCRAMVAISPNARQWSCIGNVDLPDDSPCGAGGDAVDYAGYLLERSLGLDSASPTFREQVEAELARRGLPAGR